MVVYDACTWDLNGRFPPGDSRLSELVGVRYAHYDLYHTEAMGPEQIIGSAAAMREIGIPPGSFAPAGSMTLPDTFCFFNSDFFQIS